MVLISMASRRYIAEIKIVEVQEQPTAYDGNLRQHQHVKDIELASLVVRDSSLSSLIVKTKAHLDLTMYDNDRHGK
jgi:hypothetical protein